MQKNYLIIAWRNLWKHKIFSFINIFGLAVGITFTLLIGAYVWGELQVNRGLKDAGNQYIILSKWTDPNKGNEIQSIAQLSQTLKDNYPGLVANYYNAAVGFTSVSKANKRFYERLQIGDSTFLNMYGFKLLYGDANTALHDPSSVVITGSVALKYFGRTDVVGQTLYFDDHEGKNRGFTITGVLDKCPANTLFEAMDAFDNNVNFFFNASAGKYFHRDLQGWDNVSAVDHIELQTGADPKVVEKAMLRILQKNEPDNMIRTSLNPRLMKLTDFNMEINNGMIRKMAWTLSCIALFVLLMAIINFVNISIGRSSGRIKEMGIRKVMGGLRKQLIGQFLTESILMVMLATALSLVIYILAKQYFSELFGGEQLELISFPAYFITLPFIFAILIGFIAGIYPALVLSSLKAVDSLKGKQVSVKESVFFRKALVAFQFTTAAVVFIGSLIISQQISLFFSSKLGYKKDYVIYAQLPRNWSAAEVQKMEAARYQLAQMQQVSSAALSFDVPNGHNSYNYAVYKRGDRLSKTVTAQGLVTDNQFAAVYNIPLKAGTFFNPVYSLTDSSKAVINETEAKALGWSDPTAAIGQKIMIFDMPLTVCGVTADFHFGSMHQRIMPLTITNVNHDNSFRYFSIRLKPGNMQQSIEALQKKWAEVLPAAPFEYHFMDDALNSLYKNEIQLKKAAYAATILAIIIVLLGVLGLISLSIQKRTKEIGIRKVLGSSIAGITTLFLKDFLSVILIAGIIACPLAYLIMQNWLNDYVYKISISFSPFVFSITSLTVLTAFLITLQTIKAAFANPVESLRNE